jgi:hypothetical protein
LIGQQQARLDVLINNLVGMFDIHRVADDTTYSSLPVDGYHIGGDWWMPLGAICDHLDDQGSAARDGLAALPASERRDLVVEIAKYVSGLVAGLSLVRAERDSNNRPNSTSAPPTMPAQLVGLRTSKFVTDVLDPHRSRLTGVWSAKEMEQIEEDHKALRNTYRDEAVFRHKIDAHDLATSFNAGWDDARGRFCRLRTFCGGLATAFANTSSVESDFSILKWEKDEFRSSMSQLSLEGIFQAKQFQTLTDLASRL